MHCISEQFTIGRLHVERNVIDEMPDYQRESGVWSTDKKQLLIDSIMHDYDIPKIYMHDLRGQHPTMDFAIIDGKQRLDAIWSFLTDDFPLGDLGTNTGKFFSELNHVEQELFKAKSLTVVLVQNAESDDIEELFSRLNNGEPLNAAEKRNAFGGNMARLVAEIAKNDFFESKVKFSGRRYAYLEASAKLLLIEATVASGGSPYCDLKKKFLDKLVLDNKDISKDAQDVLSASVSKRLLAMSRVFQDNDPLLDKQAYVPMYYLLTRHLFDTYASSSLANLIHQSLESFKSQRAANLKKPEEDRDPVLSEFGRLMQQGTNDRGSLESRVETLSRFFITEYPDVVAKDPKRLFNDDERHVLWINAGKKCQNCGVDLPELALMHADHIVPHSEGGVTQLSNGQCLCADCNQAKGSTA